MLKPLRTLSISFALVAATATPQVFANDFEEQITRGQELYTEVNCAKCHAEGTHFAEGIRKSTDFPSLRGWVSGCAQFLKHDWFPEDETAVALYLNKVYYHYDVPVSAIAAE